MIRFSVPESPLDSTQDYKRLIRDSEGRVVPMALRGYRRAAEEAGVDPNKVPDDVFYDPKTLAYVFTFKDAETYPALYSRSVANLLAIGLNPKGYGALNLMNDFPAWRPGAGDITVSNTPDIHRTAKEIGQSIREARRARG